MNRTFVAAVIAGVALASAAHADPPPEPGPWQYGLVTGLNLSQSTFSNNWSGGDKGAINWVLNIDADAKRQVSRRFNWSNQLQLAYGQTTTQEPQASNPSRKRWTPPDKTTDLILFESVGRWTLQSYVDPYAAFRLDSQFQDDSDPVGTLVFNPVKLTESAGIARVFVQQDKKEVVSRLGFGIRQSLAREFTDATGNNTTSFHTSDGGLELETDAKLPMARNRVLYTGKLLVFWPLFFDQSSDLKDFDTLALAANPSREAVADFWKVPDVNWQNTFTSEVTSWLNVNLYVQWVYDKFDAATNVKLGDAATNPATLAKLTSTIDRGIRKSGQFKQTLAIGLTYRFI